MGAAIAERLERVTALLHRVPHASQPWTVRNLEAYERFLRARELERLEDAGDDEQQLQAVWFDFTLRAWFLQHALKDEVLDSFFNLGIWSGAPSYT